jgi:hypothetical protein
LRLPRLGVPESAARVGAKARTQSGVACVPLSECGALGLVALVDRGRGRLDLMFCVESQPAAFCSKHFNVYTGDADREHRMKFAKGTTTLSFVFEGGVIVAVDSRSTQGPYIGESPRLSPWKLAHHLFLCSFWVCEEGH